MSNPCQKAFPVKNPFLCIFFVSFIFIYRVRVLYCPPPLELKKKFSDGSRRFEFEWVISGQGLKIGLALKSRFTRENLRFSKSFQTGQGCLSSRGGGDNKVHEHGKRVFLNHFIGYPDFYKVIVGILNELLIDTSDPKKDKELQY